MRLRAGRKKRYLFALGTGLLCLAFVFCILEGALRVFHYLRGDFELSEEALEARTSSIWMKSDDPVLVYTHRPNYVKNGVRYTEAHGILRPHDVPEKAAPDVLRIALIGDSIAASVYLDYGERLGSRVESLINDHAGSEGRKTEVLNFSVNGYRTIQEARLVELKVQRFNPELLIVQYCMNDPGNSLTPTIWFMDIERPRSHLLNFIDRKLFYRHGAGRAKLSDAVPVFGPGYGTSEYWYELYDPDSESWKSVEQGFRRIDDYARRQGIPVVLAIFPFLLDGDSAMQKSRPFHRRVREAGARHGFYIIDLFEPFQRYSSAALRQYENDIYHLNPTGHRIAADAIFAGLKQSGLLNGEAGAGDE